MWTSESNKHRWIWLKKEIEKINRVEQFIYEQVTNQHKDNNLKQLLTVTIIKSDRRKSSYLKEKVYKKISFNKLYSKISKENVEVFPHFGCLYIK